MKSKFTFSNETKTEIRHNLVPEFLIEIIKLDAPSDYKFGELIFIDDIFAEVLIRRHHFIFKIKVDEFEEIHDDEVFHLRSICKRAAKWYKSQVVAGFIPLEKLLFKSGAMEDEFFKLQKSDKENWWIVAHKDSNLIIEFEQGKINETQKVSDFGNQEIDMMKSARIMREIGEWLSKNHQNLL